MEATEVEMEQPYWAGIHDSLADGIQFVENHAGLTESIEGFPQLPTKKRARITNYIHAKITNYIYFECVRVVHKLSKLLVVYALVHCLAPVQMCWLLFWDQCWCN